MDVREVEFIEGIWDLLCCGLWGSFNLEGRICRVVKL